jgi:hypothetical protein
MLTMKAEGLDVVHRQVHPDGLAIEIHQATLNSCTKWFVVAYPRTSPVKTIADCDSLVAARVARDSYRGPR